MEWIFNRTDVPFGSSIKAEDSAIGMLPSSDAMNLVGLNQNVDMDELLSLPRDFWLKEVDAIRKFFDEQVNTDLPLKVAQELDALEKRVQNM